jgi:hypothetical protein
MSNNNERLSEPTMTIHSPSFTNSTRLLATAFVLMLTVTLQAQFNASVPPGVTSTTDGVGIGVTTGLQAKLDVRNASTDTVLALYGRTSNNYGTGVSARVYDTATTEGVCCGLIAEFQGNSAIKVSNLRIGLQGTPVVTSLGGGPLYLNSIGVLGFTPGDVIVGDTGLGNGLRVKSAGYSSFAGSVGIGTESPARTLSFANAVGEKISLYSSSSTPHDYYGFGIAGAELQYQVTAGAHHSFYVGTVEKVRIDSSGNLSAAGSITGATVYATYQDVAEWVPAAVAMAAGTVVVVGEDADNTVTASMHAYDTSVAGVVSANPGLLLGVASASKAKIATTGRVRVRVDATKSPIRKGDLLVTSDRPGMAMKSEPLDLGGVKIHRPGTLIGKALEPLAGGEGEILVLLSLQ